MKLAVQLLAILTCVWVTCGPAAAEWYAWQDSNGTLHVTDQFASIPSDARWAPVVLPYGQPGGGASTVVKAGADMQAAALDPVRGELARHEARLATRQAHLQLLRASMAAPTMEQLRMENLLENEIRAEATAIAKLRQTIEEDAHQ